MKNTILTLILNFGLACFTSCNNEGDIAVGTESVDGEWNLKNVQGVFVDVNIDYAEGEVKWIFDLDEETLTVENNILTTGPEDNCSDLDTGVYIIAIDEKTQNLLVNEINKETISVTEDSFIITQIESDKFFVRI